MALFESYERRIDKINEVLAGYGISSIEEAQQITKDAGLDVYNQIKMCIRDRYRCVSTSSERSCAVMEESTPAR